MNNIGKYKIFLLLSVTVLLLLTMLSYPFGYDQTVFAVGGESLLKNGAFPGHDFIDTKPPISLSEFLTHKMYVCGFVVIKQH